MANPLPENVMIIGRDEWLFVGTRRDGVEKSFVAVEAKLKPVRLSNPAKASAGNSQTLSFAGSGEEESCFLTLPGQQSLSSMASGEDLLAAAGSLSSLLALLFWRHPGAHSARIMNRMARISW
jgi:hypothetical protein